MNSPKDIANNYISVAKNKVATPVAKTLVLAFLAGAFIALAGISSTMASWKLVDGWSTVVKGCIFPLGLALVVLCGSELFTGNCLLVAPLLSKEISLGKTAKNLALVYVGNLVGSIFVALLVSLSLANTVDGLAEHLVAVATNKVNLGFGNAFVLGILCNILVCLAVWMTMASNTAGGKILALFLPVACFVICGFEHSVANMYYLFAGLFCQGIHNVQANLGLLDVLVGNLLPVTLGNMVGGMLFVALPYWFVYLKK